MPILKHLLYPARAASQNMTGWSSLSVLSPLVTTRHGEIVPSFPMGNGRRVDPSRRPRGVGWYVVLSS